MKQGQFSQEQSVAILQQAEKGDSTIQAICCEHNHYRNHLLSLAQNLWRNSRLRSPSTQGTRKGECQLKEALRRSRPQSRTAHVGYRAEGIIPLEAPKHSALPFAKMRAPGTRPLRLRAAVRDRN